MCRVGFKVRLLDAVPLSETDDRKARLGLSVGTFWPINLPDWATVH